MSWREIQCSALSARHKHTHTHKTAGRQHIMTIDNVFYDPGCHINLVSMTQLKRAGYKAMFSPNSDEEMFTFTSEEETFQFPLLDDDDMTLLPTASLLTRNSACQFTGRGCVNYEELVHLTMCHAGADKFEHFNACMTGLQRKLHWHKENFKACPDSCCMDAKAICNLFPPASTHLDGTDMSMWQWDLIDMGSDCLTINDNRYASIFMIRKSHYAMVFLHKTRDEIPGITCCGSIMMARS